MNRLRNAAIPVLFGAAGLFVAFSETVLSGFTLQRHDLGDTRFVNYALEHELRWLLGNPWHPDLFDRPFFFAAQNVGAYADVYVGALPLYAPLRIFFEYDTAFLAYGFVVCAANYAAMYLLLRKAGPFSQLPSAAGAALFAFANTRMMMAMHWQMFPHYWSVITLFCLWALTQELTPRRKQLAIAVGILSVAGQLWAGYYLGWFLLFGLAVAAPLALAMKRIRTPILRALWAHRYVTAASALVAALLLWPLARAYLSSAAESGMRPFGEVMTMLPPPVTWLNMGHQSVPYGKLTSLFEPLRHIPMDHEQRACMGYLSMLLMIAGLLAGRKRPGVLIAGGSLILIMVFATHFSGKTLWRYVYDLFPGAQAIRAVSRISLLLLIPGAVLVAAAIQSLLELRHKRLGVTAALLLSTLAIAEQGHEYGAYDIAQNRREVRAIAKQVHPRCELFAVSPLGDGHPYWKNQLDAMSAQLLVGIPTLNGYSGRAPIGWDLTDIRINNGNDELAVAGRLRDWIERSGLSDFRVCHLKVGHGSAAFDAEFQQQPLTVTSAVGGRFSVHLTAKNTGSQSWTPDGRFLLAPQLDRDQRVFGPVGIPVPREVRPGESVTFDFVMQAPAQPGGHELQFRLVNRQTGWFGELAPIIRAEIFDAPH